MSKGEVLFTGEMNVAEPDDSGSDIWDDSKLREAFFRAKRYVNDEVAKRIAMSTNNMDRTQNTAAETTAAENTGAETTSEETEDKNVQWEAGMHCRAIYEKDGLEYEALLLSIDEEECNVKFLGYSATQKVPISSLKRSYGKKEQIMQMSTCDDEMGSNMDEVSGFGDIGKWTKTKRSKKRKNNRPKRSGSAFPEFSFSMPNFDAMGCASSVNIPPPMPLTGLSQTKLETEDEALSTMLTSWYMNGYFTGLYQGIKKRAKKNSEN